jgi:hypothetical protein
MKVKINLIWDSIQKDKELVTKFLATFYEKNNSCCLKKLYYDDIYKNKKIPLIIGHLPDKYHALFLIEAIRVNDYLFNRKTNISQYYPPDEFSIMANIFRNDGINILLSVDDNIEEIFGETNYFGSMKFVNLKDEKLLKNLDQGWKLYLNWINNGMQENQNPLVNSNLYWCNFNVLIQRSSSIEKFPNSSMYPLYDSLLNLVRISSIN